MIVVSKSIAHIVDTVIFILRPVEFSSCLKVSIRAVIANLEAGRTFEKGKHYPMTFCLNL